VTSAVALVVMLALATGIFGLSFFAYGLTIVPFLLMLFLFGVALGILGSGMVLRLGPAAEWFVWPIPALVSPFVGVFYPLSTLPPWMQHLARLLPPSYVFEGLRRIIAGEAAPASLLVTGAALAVAYVVLACWVFRRVYHHAARSGLLVRYSAENVS
jgi:ABC-2 type transport system permease protein